MGLDASKIEEIKKINLLQGQMTSLNRKLKFLKMKNLAGKTSKINYDILIFSHRLK